MARRGRRHITTEIFQEAQKHALCTKMRAEIALMDRDVKRHQSEFGVALFNAIVNHQQCYQDSDHPPTVFQVDGLQSDFEHCLKAVQAKGNEVDAKEMQMESISVNRERAPQPISASVREKVHFAGVWATDTALLGKLVVEVKLLQREMRILKEQFGVAVFDKVISSQQDAAPVALESETDGNQAVPSVNQVIASAAAAIAIVYEQRDSKHRELVAMLDEGSL